VGVGGGSELHEVVKRSMLRTTDVSGVFLRRRWFPGSGTGIMIIPVKDSHTRINYCYHFPLGV
jgi:hypothetical protein